MKFCMNEFLMAVSFALDFVEMDILGVKSNHGKRTAYLSLKLAESIGLSFEELHDITALGILHDNGVTEKSLQDRIGYKKPENIGLLETVKEHCLIGEDNVTIYPFLTDVRDVLKYHHEKFDGTGFFNLKNDNIPIMSQIIGMADFIEINFDLQNNDAKTKNKIFSFLKEQENKLFSPKLVKSFCEVGGNTAFWMDLRGENINSALKKSTPQYSVDMSFEDIHRVTQVLSKIIDSKSSYTQRHSRDLAEKASIMSEYYGKENDEKMKLIIAADLHDIGKLAVPNEILDSPGKLTDEEFEIIKQHPYYTRLALQEINGFEDITEWAANHHEKINAQGYPYGVGANKLDFNSRLIGCLDVYEALTEERPYRSSLSHSKAMEILNQMSYDGLVDSSITSDINYVFKQL